MTNTVEVATEKLVAQARDLGAEHGKIAAGWVDFTFEIAKTCIETDAEGDPMWDDMFPAGDPLSGEMADDLTPKKLIEDELDIVWESCSAEEIDEISTAYEDAFRDAHNREVLRRAELYAPEVRYTSCHNCELDIEVWRDGKISDRGGNAHCPSGERHVPSDS